MFLALVQTSQQSQDSSLTLSAVAIIAIVSVGLQWLIGRDTRNKLEGSFGARLDSHDTDIKDLKQSKSELWKTVNGHSVEIGKLQTTQDLKRSHHA